jgi:hypothetical protein
VTLSVTASLWVYVGTPQLNNNTKSGITVVCTVIHKVINMILNYNTHLLETVAIVVIFLKNFFNGTFPLGFGNFPVDCFTLGENMECFPEGH